MDDVMDKKLLNMVRVMGGSRKSLSQARAELAAVHGIAQRADNQEPLAIDAIAEARVMLRQCITTLVAVHDNLAKAEESLSRIKK